MALRNCPAHDQNPTSRPKPHSIAVIDDHETLLLGADFRRVRALSLRDFVPTRKVVAELGEEHVEGVIVNSPACVDLSPDGKFTVLGYRGH